MSVVWCGGSGENLELNDLDEEKLQEAIKKQKEFQKQKVRTTRGPWWLWRWWS